MMSYQRKSAARMVIAFVVSIALVFSLLPLLPQNEAHADGTDLIIHTRIGDDEKTSSAAFGFSDAELDAMAHNDARGFLQSGSYWSVRTTNKYITLDELLAKAETAFNGGDKLLFLVSDRSGGYYRYGKSSILYEPTYETIQAEKYFYPGTGEALGERTKDGPIDVGMVLSLNNKSQQVSTSAKVTFDTVVSSDLAGADVEKRFLMGVSEASYLKNTDDGSPDPQAGGYRFPNGVLGIMIAKDKKDELKNAEVTFDKTTYPAAAAGTEIKPVLTVKLDGATLKEDTDYKAVYADNKLPGEAKVTLTGIGAYKDAGAIEKTFTITGEIKDATVTFANTTYTANGKQIQPVVTIKYGDKTLTPITDYTVVYGPNIIGEGVVTIKSAGKYYTGEVEKKFTITGEIKDATITLTKTTYTATGRKIQPSVMVKYGEKALAPFTDYRVVYGTNTLGKGTVTIEGQGIYTGKTVKNFKINPRPVSIRIVKAGKKKATVKWIKAPDAVSGYQIAYKKKGTSGYTTVKFSGRTKVSRVITKLTAKTQYSFKIRTWKSSGGVTYYSAYSKVRTSAKIKK
jgi:hypothetical protein